MKKLLSILTLLMCFSSGVWADEFVLSQTTATSFVDDKPSDGKAITFSSNGQTFSIAKGSTAGTAGKMGANLLKLSKNATYTITLPENFTITAINFKGYANNENGTDVKIDKVNGANTNWEDFPGNGVASTESSWGDFTFNVTGDAQTASTITFHISNKQQIGVIITITGYVTPVGLTIKTQPVSAEYIPDATATPLTVVAQGGTEPYTYQWYSCTDAEKAGASAIGGATNASYIPSTAATGYYYCKVTDSATPTPASVESDVATITVSAAAAPTFTSVTPSATNVVKGTASTITAVVEGNPDPTVTWYSCDDAEKTNPVEAGTGLVLNLTNDVMGTFYYYAVATNSIGSATSDVQTISVKEKLATPTVSGDRYFLESVTATIEGPDGATIKFIKNGGAEETYNPESKPTSDANMTLVVWAVRDGYIDSDPVTVNFKKVTDTGVTAVDEVSSWDWSKPTGTKVEPSPIQLETLLSEITSLNYDEFEPATTSVKYINAQRFDTDNNHVQAHGFIIKTAVSGTLDFKVRGTNSNNRQLIVNGKVAGTVNSSSSDKNIKDVAIPAGVTLVYGLDVNSQAANNLRYYNVTFTPAVNVTSEGWATATTPSYAVDFDENAEVYIATAAGENITLTKITDAPANTAVVVNAPAGSYTMIKKAEATTDVTKNLLKSSDGSIVGTTTGSPYVLGKNSSKVVGFGPLANGVTLAAGKAYIPASAFSGAKDFYPFVIGDENETTSINSIENGELRIENSDYIYNLAGQKVSKDYKGIVIVNGKKVIRK